MTDGKLIAVDGNSLMHRAFHALPPMITRDGVPTGALHGFLSMLFKLVDMKPTYLVVAFDTKQPTFRHERYLEYKAGRKPTADELRAQFPLIRELLRAMGIAVCECPGFEADDIIGTYARIANEAGVDALLVTGDRDALQLVDGHTHVLVTKKGVSESFEYTPEAIEEQYGVPPRLMPDLKGLMGDSSDNLPGVPGVGEKTAVKLLQKYGSIDKVLDNWENEKGALSERLRNGVDSAKLSYALGIIDTAAPVSLSLADCTFEPSAMAAARSRLLELELRAIAARLPEGKSATVPKPSVNKPRETIVSDEAGLAVMIDAISSAEQVAFDIGTDMTVAVPGGSCYRVVMEQTLMSAGLTAEAILSAMRPILSGDWPKKLCFDAKSHMKVLKKYGVSLDGLVFDAMIVDYLLDPVRNSKSISELAERRLGHAGNAAECVAELQPAMMEELSAAGARALYRDVELPLIGVLFDMEQAGFAVDRTVLAQLGDAFDKRLKSAEAAIYELAGETFNILSTKQLGAVLFENLGLPPQRKTKTGFSTDSEVLEELADKHPIVPLILEYRGVSKLKSTFIDGLVPLMDVEGRIHTSFNQTVTATGRLSSTEPNLQNIPVRTEDGREIRRAFIAAPGYELVGADYSQIELRLLAHMSGDERMIDAFKNDVDIHTRTAAEVFGMPIDAVTHEQRSAAKAVNFGIVYGISDYGLARQLGIPRRRAVEYIENYFRRYPDVKAFLDSCIDSAKRNGYAETLMGRRRAMPELKSSNYNLRSFGERVAMNMPIQGSAADIIKLAMVSVGESIRAAGIDARLVLQVHDELIVEASVACVERARDILQQCMEDVMRLSVPLKVDVHTGGSWYDTK